MFIALLRAFNQLSDPPVRRVVWVGILTAAAAFALLALAVWFALTRIDLLGGWGWTWLNDAFSVLGGVAVLGLAWFLFPAAAALIASLLLDDVVGAVERRHYPTLPPPRRQPPGESVATALRFFTVTLAVNLVALPLYLMPVANIFIFLAINGYLLGREYFELVALRRLNPADARTVRYANRLKLFSAGVIIAFLSTIPLVNLLVPVVASAFMVHVCHGLKGSLRCA